MRSRYHVTGPHRWTFLTSTVQRWLPVFTRPEHFQILVDALRHAQEHKGLRIHAYVIMENHCHLIACAEDLSSVMQSVKSYSAKALLASLEERRQQGLLDQLRDARLDHKTDSRYQFWQEGFHPQEIQDEAMLAQKAVYIHHNPVRRGYVLAPEHWLHSSAAFWLCGTKGPLPVEAP